MSESESRMSTGLPVVPHWIGGAEYPASGRTAPIYDPALGVETKRVALAGQAEVDAAVAAASAAFPAWSDVSLARRQMVLFRFRELLDARKGELAEIITSEHGKVLSDALGEISRGQEVVEFATGLAHHLTAITPRYYVLCRTAPSDPADPAAWPAPLAAGTGRA